MSHALVTPAAVGRPCPYCRFPLKDGIAVEECERCHALHHSDCWADGSGCAVVGCGQPAKPSAAPVAIAPEALVAVPPPQPPVAAPVAARPVQGGRGMVVGIACGLLIAAAGVGGYVVATGGKDEPAGGSTARTQTRAATPTTPAPPAPAPSPFETEGRIVRRMERIISFSMNGRTAVQAGRYDDAIANRRSVLARLDALPAASGRLARAQAALREAMQASLESDRSYARGADASASDARATDRKRAFVELWNPIATKHGAAVYSEGQI